MNGLRLLFLMAALFIAARIAVVTVRHCRAQHEDFSNLAIESSDGTDPVEIVDQAMQPIRQLLKGQPRVEYVSSHPPNTDPAGIRGWVGLQYALAPTVVAPEATLPWILTYFDSAEELKQFREKGRHELIADSVVGVRLFRAYGDRP